MSTKIICNALPFFSQSGCKRVAVTTLPKRCRVKCRLEKRSCSGQQYAYVANVVQLGSIEGNALGLSSERFGEMRIRSQYSQAFFIGRDRTTHRVKAVGEIRAYLANNNSVGGRKRWLPDCSAEQQDVLNTFLLIPAPIVVWVNALDVDDRTKRIRPIVEKANAITACRGTQLFFTDGAKSA